MRPNYKTRLAHEEIKSLVLVLLRFDLRLMPDVRMSEMVRLTMNRFLNKVVKMSLEPGKEYHKLTAKPGEAAALMYTLSLFESAGYEGLVHDRLMYELNGYFA